MKSLLHKRSLWLFICLIMPVTIMASVVKISDGKHGYSIIKNTDSFLEIEYSINSLNAKEISNEAGTFTELSFKSGFLSRTVGAPALPTFRNLIEIPCEAGFTIEVLSYEETVYTLEELGISHPVSPVQPSYSKSTDPSEIYFRYNQEVYNTDAFNTDELVTLKKGGISRGVGIGNLVISPFRYNPVQGIIKVYNNLRFKIKYNGNISHSFTRKMEEYSPVFEGMFGQLINYRSVPDEVKASIETYPITYLVVASDALEGNADLNAFLAWKEKKGFTIVENYVSSSTGTSTIDSWIETQYNTLTPKPSFILLVGDESGTYCVDAEDNVGSASRSDLLYSVMGTVSSSNDVPSMYLGRFSVNSTAELTAQTDKTIWYEIGQFENSYDLSYLSNVMICAGVDGGYGSSHGNPQVLYGMTYYFNDTYTNPLYTSDGTFDINGISYLYPASDGSGVSSEIIGYCSDGLAFYNYTAHGSQTSFGDPSFTISNINSLSNANEYGMIVGNCCLTGSFGTTECFGEAWLNAADKGAIAYLGASMSTYWDEDLAMGVGLAASGGSCPAHSPDDKGMYDGAMLMEYSDDDAYPYTGAIRFIGLMAVENYGGNSNNYWLAYHLFGDPSVLLYFGVPKDMTVTHSPTIEATATTFDVSACPYAYCAISDPDGNLHGAARADANGDATITMTALSGHPTGTLTVTAQFKKPYTVELQIGDPEPPVCDFQADQTTVLEGEIVNFTDLSTNYPSEWAWTFDGGTPGTSTEKNPSIQYTTAGTYDVALTVTNTAGTDSETKNGYITVNANTQTPTADFEADVTSILVGESVDFTDLSTGLPTSWLWTFDGGTPGTSTDQNPANITYNNPGSYTVTLQATNANGSDTEEKTGYILVTAEFIMDNDNINTCAGTFYDPGGTSEYSNSTEYTTTITPTTAGSMLRVTFSSFDVEYQASCDYDYLEIFDGTSTGATLLGKYCGTNSPGIVDATNASGALTFHFYSDYSVTAAGWVATIECVVGIDETEQENTFAIYPNPSKDIFTLDLGTITNADIYVFDMFGKLVKFADKASDSIQIDLSEQANGIYYIKVVNEACSITKKVILVK